MAHSESSPTRENCFGGGRQGDRGLCHTFLIHLHCLFGFTRFLQQPLPPPDLTRHQVLFSSQICSPLHSSVQDWHSQSMTSTVEQWSVCPLCPESCVVGDKTQDDLKTSYELAKNKLKHPSSVRQGTRVYWPCLDPWSRRVLGGRRRQGLLTSDWFSVDVTSLVINEPELGQEVEQYQVDKVWLTSTHILRRGWTLSHFPALPRARDTSAAVLGCDCESLGGGF